MKLFLCGLIFIIGQYEDYTVPLRRIFRLKNPKMWGQGKSIVDQYWIMGPKVKQNLQQWNIYIIGTVVAIHGFQY